MTRLRMLFGRGEGGLPPPAPVDFATLRLPSTPNAWLAALPGGAGLFLYSRSLLGRSDFGVNRRRIHDWRAAFDAALAGAG